jgi:hypothetical protein
MKLEPLQSNEYMNLFVYSLLMLEVAVRYVTFGLYKPTVFALVDWLVYEIDERRQANV